ncbi:hypothetical protein K6959_03070 [Bacillus aquiflavi]|uniref:hypothetical protein n=1 Tax=Bacillus aquiflavi TaxID=2672567 RepID=UPI001CA97004|nr:hypothetical protein [Bacillus aquiflavi]UAC48914.1 hypothetical protein K6959_03070 [Bacillus aquiflavi]
MLKQCNENDFYQIKTVAENRLRPDRMTRTLWGAFMFSGMITAVLSFGSGYSIYVTNPIWPVIVKISSILLAVQFVVTVFFTKRKIAYKFQRTQSLLLSTFLFKMSIDVYAVYFLSCEDKSAPSYMTTTGFILLIGGLLYLVISTIMGIKRVQQGELRKGGKGLYNLKQSKGQVSLPIIFGATMMGGTIARFLSDVNTPTANMASLFFARFFAVVLQYAMTFASPELFLLTYCKFKFESFRIPMPTPVEFKQNQTIQFRANHNGKVSIERLSFELYQVISATTKCKIDEWHYTAIEFDAEITKLGLESSGILIYKSENFDQSANEADYTFYIPVNTPIEMEANDIFDSYKIWKFNDGLLLKNVNFHHIKDFYDLLRTKAKEDQLTLEEPFYHILNEEGILHIYAPIIEEQKEKTEVI